MNDKELRKKKWMETLKDYASMSPSRVSTGGDFELSEEQEKNAKRVVGAFEENTMYRSESGGWTKEIPKDVDKVNLSKEAQDEKLKKMDEVIESMKKEKSKYEINPNFRMNLKKKEKEGYYR